MNLTTSILTVFFFATTVFSTSASGQTTTVPISAAPGLDRLAFAMNAPKVPSSQPADRVSSGPASVSVAPAEDAATATSQANNPLANFKAFNMHNYYIGRLTDKGAGWPEWQIFIGLNMQFK